MSASKDVFVIKRPAPVNDSLMGTQISIDALKGLREADDRGYAVLQLCRRDHKDHARS